PRASFGSNLVVTVLELICEVCNENRWKIIAMEIMPDHVHLFLDVRPTDDPASVIRKIRSRASH
ncbi:transposase, partial [Fischerella thermalis]|uniref:transposase n=1 Tax=Fischerella thermalis TaxID=372787 RepID=UPI000CBBAA5F